MALEISAAETCKLIQRAGGGPMVTSLNDGLAHVVFYAPEERSTCCLIIKADEAWMHELVRLSSTVWAKSLPAFIETAERYWPADDNIRRMRALIEF